MMLKAVKIALDPTPRQERLMLSHAGAARFAYNAALAHVIDQLEHKQTPDWSYYALRKWWNQAKHELAVDAEGNPWWEQNSKEAANSGLEALALALKNFNESRKGKRRGRRMGFPKFKRKNTTPPKFAYTTGVFGPIAGDPHGVRLPKIGRVHCMENVTDRVCDAKVLRMTVSRHAGRWYASLTIETTDDNARTTPCRGSVGVDLGIKHLAVLSDGTVFDNPRAFRRNQRKLARLQQAVSRKTNGSKRRERARRALARQHARVANIRADATHKMTAFITREYGEVSIEDLNVAGMLSNHRLAQAVADANFGETRRQLEYKCVRSGALLHVIDRFYPSSKTCSRCGNVRTKLALTERTYHCDNCGLSLDRDLNAAINIQVAGSAPETINARGGNVRRSGYTKATQYPVKREPSNQPEKAGVRLGADLSDKVMLVCEDKQS